MLAKSAGVVSVSSFGSGEMLQTGKGRIVQKGEDVAILSFGAHLGEI